MKKVKSIILLTLMLAGTFQINVFACGLPPCSGGTLVAGGGGCSGNPEASVYDCGGHIQVISTLLPGGGCAGAHRDCSTTPPQFG
ncbi:hypothetical protein [Algoriphagus marinus]|uniref:hypothetical protein n=1 Tax=Algoriphagus marinus TaxID=1925762 RepID=UPI00094BA113|nr:hypothetical protein [Algoriphagus marinus]